MKIAIAVIVAVLALSPFSALTQELPSPSTPVYGIKDNGDMLFYKYAGAATGSPTWAIQGKKIGTGGILSRSLLEVGVPFTQ